jgi:hypothetical protein
MPIKTKPTDRRNGDGMSRHRVAHADRCDGAVAVAHDLRKRWQGHRSHDHQSRGSTTFYGRDVRVTGRWTVSGNTRTFYDADGRKTGTVTTTPRKSK